MVATKLFSCNKSDNLRHSAVKSLYAECFAVYYRGCHLKETSQNRLLLTPEKSLTMKLYSSLISNSDGIFSVSFSVHLSFGFRSILVHPPFILRSSSVHPPFELRSSSVRAPFNLRSSSVHPPFNLRSSSVQPPFELRSTSVHPPFVLRSFSVHSPFGNRRLIEERTENHRRQNGDVSKL